MHISTQRLVGRNSDFLLVLPCARFYFPISLANTSSKGKTANKLSCARLVCGFANGIMIMIICFQISSGFGAVIVEQGKPNAAIIASDDAPDSVRLAVSELQGYVEKVTGARLPILKEPIPQSKPGVNLFLGESSFTKALGLNMEGLTSDGFKIVGRDNWLAILGRDYHGKPIVGLRDPWLYHQVYNEKLKIGAFGETGTLYGVYRFLEDYCGVRWYMPGDLGTVIPKMETIRVETVDCQKSPDFEYRYPWFCNFDQSDEDALWYRRVGFGAAYPVQIIHSFSFFLKYKDTHPEYFALIGGKRDFSNLSCIGGEGNLCLSNPDVAKQWVADINDYFDKNPQQFVFPLMPSDGMVKLCECKQCQSQIDPSADEGGKFSNYVWNFVNEVAKEVYKTHPDKMIGCCGYEDYHNPPTNIKKLNPNVAVMICKTRGSYNDKQKQKSVNNIITGWRKKVNNVYTWEYYIWYSWRPWTGFPVIFPHIISDDLRFLKGVYKGEFLQAESWEDGVPPTGKIDYPGMQHVNLYVTAKLLWDSSLDVDKLMNEYYAKYYGPAGEEMKGFWNTAEEIWMTACPPGEKETGDWINPVNIYKKDKLDKLSSLLEKARLKAPEDSVYRKRVELINSEFTPARKKLSNVLVVNPPQLTVAGPTSEIRVDGVLDDSAWREAVSQVFVDKDGEAAKYKTLAYTAWDKDYLYFAFINYETEISKLTALATERDQSVIFGDDAVEIFISPNPEDRAKCYQFVVNAKGAIWDGVRNSEIPGGIDDKWNSDFSAKTKIEANRWIVEVKIPFKAIGITAPPAVGKKVAANLYRNRHCGQGVVYSCWSPTLDSAHFTPNRFGQIIFESE